MFLANLQQKPQYFYAKLAVLTLFITWYWLAGRIVQQALSLADFGEVW